MSTLEIKDKSKLLREANKAYRLGHPIMLDDEYDYLEKDVRRSNPNDPALLRIEDDDFGETRFLTIAMGSQDKAHNLEEMNRFYNRIDTSDAISASEKMDGFSAEITYKHGNFCRALTRGDGSLGVDITSMVRGAKDLPILISERGYIVVVRGEFIITKSDLVELNKVLVEDTREPYQNTRNGAVGLVKTLKNRKYSKFLSFRAFDIIGVNYHA